MSLIEVLSVRYIVIRGLKLEPAGSAFIISARYANAWLVFFIGRVRFGITTALPICAALMPTIERMTEPLLRCRCQSSGITRLIVFIELSPF
jgi:hypothetical protein